MTKKSNSSLKEDEEIEEAISVSVRVRPMNSKENRQNCKNQWRVIDGNSICSIEGQPQTHTFGKFLQRFYSSVQLTTFIDNVFVPETSTVQVYNRVAKNLVSSVLHGINGTVFAYGQTASGKTFTMQGEPDSPGILNLAAEQVFDEIDKMQHYQFLLHVSYIEVFNEQVKDLLCESGTNLRIREDRDRGFFVEDLEMKSIVSVEELLAAKEEGERRRHVGETNMNLKSSRSHTIFTLKVEMRDSRALLDDDEELVQPGTSGKRRRSSAESSSADDCRFGVLVGQLNLVDLAGSENARATGAEGGRLKEGGNINKSLLTLSRVISQLASAKSKAGFINWRDSKLTQILQPSLAGNCRTAIVCCVTPASKYIEETKSTLNFASRAKQIRTRAIVNEVLDGQGEMRKLKRTIQQLRDELASQQAANAEKDLLEGRIASLKALLVSGGSSKLPSEDDDSQQNGLDDLQRSDLKASKQRKRKKKRIRRETWCPGDFNKENNFKTETTTRSTSSTATEVGVLEDTSLQVATKLQDHIMVNPSADTTETSNVEELHKQMAIQNEMIADLTNQLAVAKKRQDEEAETSLEREVEDLTSILNEREEERSKLQAEIEEARGAVAKARESVDGKKKELESSKVEIKDLQSMLEETQAKNATLEGELSQVRSAWEEQNEKLRTTLQKERNGFNRDISMLKAKSEESSAVWEKQIDELKKTTTEARSKLEVEMDQLRETVATHVEQKAVLEAQVAQLKSQAQVDSANQEEKSKQLAAELRSLLDAAEEECSQLKQVSADQEEACTQLEAEVAQLKCSLEAANQETAERTESAATVESELANLRCLLEEANQQIAQLQPRVSAAAKLEIELSQLKALEQENGECKVELEAEIAQLKCSLEESQQELTRMRASTEESKQQVVDDVQLLKVSHQEEVDRIRAETAANISELEQDKKDAEQKEARLEAEIARVKCLIDEVSKDDKHQKKLEEELAQWESKVQETSAQLVESQEKTTQLEADVAQLKCLLEEQKSTLESEIARTKLSVEAEREELAKQFEVEKAELMSAMEKNLKTSKSTLEQDKEQNRQFQEALVANELKLDKYRTQKANLEEAVKEQQATIESLIRKAEEVEQDLTEVRGASQRDGQVILSLEEDIQEKQVLVEQAEMELEKVTNDHNIRIAEMEAQTETLKIELSSFQESRAQQQQEFQELKELLLTQEGQPITMDVYKVFIESAELEHSTLRERALVLTQILQSKEDMMLDMQEESIYKNEVSKCLEGLICQLEADEMKSNDEQKRATDNATSLQIRKDDPEVELERLKKLVKQLELRQGLSTQSVEKLEVALQEKEKQYQELMSLAEKHKLAAKEQLADKTQQLEQLAKEFAQCKEKHAEELKHLKEEVHQELSGREQVERERALQQQRQHEQHLKEAETQLKSLGDDEKERLKQSVMAMEKKIESLTERLQEKDGVISRMEISLDEANNQVFELEKKQGNSASLDEILTEKQRLEVEVTEVRNRLTRQKQTITMMEQDSEENQLKVKTLTEQLENTETTLKSLKEEYEKQDGLTDVIAEARMRINTLEEKLQKAEDAEAKVEAWKGQLEKERQDELNVVKQQYSEVMSKERTRMESYKQHIEQLEQKNGKLIERVEKLEQVKLTKEQLQKFNNQRKELKNLKVQYAEVSASNETLKSKLLNQPSNSPELQQVCDATARRFGIVSTTIEPPQLVKMLANQLQVVTNDKDGLEAELQKFETEAYEEHKQLRQHITKQNATMEKLKSSHESLQRELNVVKSRNNEGGAKMQTQLALLHTEMDKLKRATEESELRASKIVEEKTEEIAELKSALAQKATLEHNLNEQLKVLDENLTSKNKSLEEKTNAIRFLEKENLGLMVDLRKARSQSSEFPRKPSEEEEKKKKRSSPSSPQVAATTAVPMQKSRVLSGLTPNVSNKTKQESVIKKKRKVVEVDKENIVDEHPPECAQQ